MTRFVLGTRGSALALAQAELTRLALSVVFPGLEIEQKVFVTRGDQKLDLSLIRANEAGGKGLFTKELEDALLAGTIDAAVHSLKDLPGHNPPGLSVTAVLERASTADVLITKAPLTFDALPQGAVLGTSSVRRARQLQWLRPDLRIREWRGNVQTRLRKLKEDEEVSGIVLAEAGIARLGWLRGEFGERVYGLETPAGSFCVQSLRTRLLPAIGQGAIALQSRADRTEVTAVLSQIDHPATHIAIRAERELQRLLAGDCSLPVGVQSRLVCGVLQLHAVLFSPDESVPPAEAKAQGSANDPEAIAAKVFAELTAVSPAANL